MESKRGIKLQFTEIILDSSVKLIELSLVNAVKSNVSETVVVPIVSNFILELDKSNDFNEVQIDVSGS